VIAQKDQPRSARRTRKIIRVLALWVACGFLFYQAVHAQAPDRSKPPALGPPPALNLPPIQKKTLSNGIPVWFIESHKVPLAQVNLVVLSGSGDDPAGKFGVASLTAAMLDEGAGGRSALELADAIDFLGANLSTSSSFDASAVRLNVPVDKLADALPIMADVALRPTFPQQDLERLRLERLTSLLQARDDPESIAGMAFSRIVFGATHRYGTGAMGTEVTLKAFTADDLRAFHAAHYRRSNAALVVVGDLTPDAVLPLLEKQLGGWKDAGPVKRVPVPAAPQVKERQIYIIDKPGAEQSQIRIGWVGVSRATPDYFTLLVLNTVLGGSFTSRLNQNLREKHGYTYGAGSAFDMRLSPGPFFAAAGVQTDKTADALREFFNELNAIGKTISAEELNKAKNYIALGFPSEFETIGDLSRRIEELIVYKLPEGYFENYVANVQAVDVERVRKAAATYIQPSRFAVVVVGDRKEIEPGIRGLNLGPVQVMTVDEAVGPRGK
jgi:predicted Zn-dependent peptidase